MHCLFALLRLLRGIPLSGKDIFKIALFLGAEIKVFDVCIFIKTGQLGKDKAGFPLGVGGMLRIPLPLGLAF